MQLLGRGDEREALDAVIAAVRGGMSGALVLRGDAGMGKTSLLEYAVASAPDLRIARVSGIESESEFGYAALHRLVLPFLGGSDHLPTRQRQALDTALAIIDGPPPDRFLVGLAALTLLADRAAHEPLLCIIDDAQWIDRESLDAFAFVARRLHADRIALLFAVREPAEVQVPLDGVPSITVGQLSDDVALALLATVAASPLRDDVARRIVDETRGCPLALTELAGNVNTDELATLGVVPDPLPIRSRLEAHYLTLIRSLPEATQTYLLIAAAETNGDDALLVAAARALGVDADAADAAELNNLLVTRPRVEFRHPLIRSAVYHGAPAAERRRVHATLAELISKDDDPERRVWHEAAATFGPDEAVAAELDRCAARARERGRYGEEAALLTRSADLTPDVEHRARRLLAAAEAHLVAGSQHSANSLLERALPRLTSPLLNAQAQRLRAAINSFTMPNEIPLVLFDAARAIEELDSRLALDTYAEAIEACLVSCQLTKGTTPRAIAQAALAAMRVPNVELEGTLTDLMLEGFATRLAIGYVEAVPALQKGIAALAEHDPDISGFSRWAVFGNNAAADLWDADAYRTMLERLERNEREGGALDSLRITLGGLGHCEMWAGNFGVAEALHSEASEIALTMGADATIWEMLKVELFAWQGDEVKARATINALTGAIADVAGAGVTVNLALVASTILDIALGHYEAALASSTKVFDHDFPPHGSQVLPEIVEAATRLDNRPAAEAAFARLSERARASGTPWALGLLARSKALLADDADAEALYISAIDHLSRTAVKTDLARAHLVYGEWLRRQKRRTDARTELGFAFELFSTMGATAFARRASLELSATGARARRRSVETSNELTPQERQVSRLAADGATNREIAERMFLSDSTVDYHLRKVYRKLDISSRRQLRTALA